MVLSRKPDIRSRSVPPAFDPFADYSDPLLSGYWHLGGTAGTTKGINVLGVWDEFRGNGVTVGIVDDGVDYTHPELAPNYDVTRDFDGRDNDQDAAPTDSADKHGTSVAGAVAAALDNGVGGAGAAPRATIVGYRVGFGASGAISQIEATYSRLAALDVANNSWGYDGFFTDNLSSYWFATLGAYLRNALTNGRGGRGTIVVFSAGNGRGSGQNVNYHGFQNHRGIISVAATSSNGNVASFSTPGAAILVAAPGVSIQSTDRAGAPGYNSGDYVTVSGTSFSAPIVSGVVALMLEANPNLGWRDVQEILALTAIRTGASSSWAYNRAGNWNGGAMHVSHDFGFGLVDAMAAVRVAESWRRTSTSANETLVTGSIQSNAAIPDLGSVESVINLASGVRIDRVEVDIVVTHTYIGDLKITLTSPGGTQSILFNVPPTGQDDISFTFSTTRHWGESSGGVWTLNVSDLASVDVGTLRNWTLRAYGDPVGDDIYVYTDEFSTLAAADAARRTLSDSGGVDGINSAAVSSDTHLDLRADHASIVDGQSVVIAAGTVIEYADTGDGNDTIVGNDADNSLRGWRGNDSIDGGLGSNVLEGGDGNDVMWAQSGADLLFGEDGDDYLEGNGGGDTYHGGAGMDTASFTWSNLGVNVSLLSGTGGGGHAQGATLTGIENLRGSAFNDVLTGDANANTLWGNGGSDFIDGGAGNNVLLGGDGNDVMWAQSGADLLVGEDGDDYLEGNGGGDTYHGGAGVDTASFTWSTLGVNVSLLSGTGGGGYAGEATLTGIENLRGSALSDVLTGDAGANTLWGNGGSDFIDGGLGSNVLLGGDGNDVMWALGGADLLFGEAGDDYLEGNGGGDTYDGGPGADTASFTWSPAGVTVNLAGGVAGGGHAQGAALASIENLRGSAFDDYLGGDAGPNLLWGNDGNDLINADIGNDTLIGDAGHDVLEGMDGDDVLADSGGSNLFKGGAGGDTLIGSDGNELYIGGAGNDGINPGAGSDILAFNRGDGQDTVNASAIVDNTLSLGGGIRYTDLSFTRTGNHLVFNLGGASERITLSNWYAASPANKSVLNLQVIVEAMQDFDENSADPLINQKIARFDFLGLASAFDNASNPANWALTSALLAQHLGGSDSAALGGDLAYRYGLTGTLANIGFEPAVAVLSDPAFGTSAQPLQSQGMLEQGLKRLS